MNLCAFNGTPTYLVLLAIRTIICVLIADGANKRRPYREGLFVLELSEYCGINWARHSLVMVHHALWFTLALTMNCGLLHEACSDRAV